jgi:hypothetical protein
MSIPSINTQEAVMGQAIPGRQPAVVLRSHFNHLRALLAIAMIAVAGLTVAVVVLATDSDEVSSTSAVESIEPIRYGAFNPATGRAEAAEPAGTARFDGGPEEGTRGVITTRQPNVAPGARFDGGPEEGSADVTPREIQTGTRPDGGPEEGSHLR